LFPDDESMNKETNEPKEAVPESASDTETPPAPSSEPAEFPPPLPSDELNGGASPLYEPPAASASTQRERSGEDIPGIVMANHSAFTMAPAVPSNEEVFKTLRMQFLHARTEERAANAKLAEAKMKGGTWKSATASPCYAAILFF
jgi:hypothetical protein